MKYGKRHRATPDISGIAARCFLPYKIKPTPTAPNSIAHIIVDVLSIYQLSFFYFLSQNNDIADFRGAMNNATSPVIPAS